MVSIASPIASIAGPNINSRPMRVRAYAATQTTTSSSSLYQVLGIQTGATCKEIKAAYRKLARVLHPDANYKSSDYEFIKLHEAYETLSDPDKRADYDRSLYRHPCIVSTRPVAGSGFTGYSTRRWETDQCW